MNKEKLFNFLERISKAKTWKKIVSGLGCIVVFVTVYALILPAITMTKKVQVLDCQYTVHQHDESCKDQLGNYICGKADYVIHTHNDECYDDEDKLVCTLPEIKVHKHTDKCLDEEGNYLCEEYIVYHIHNEACYKDGKLICEIPEMINHEHTKECYDKKGNLICKVSNLDDQNNIDISTGIVLEHKHSKECYDKNGKLICNLVETELHSHNIDCYKEVNINEQLNQQTVNEDLNNSIEITTNANAMPSKYSAPSASLLALTGPVDVAPYVIAENDNGQKTQLLHKAAGSDHWEEVSNSSVIKGNDSLHLDIVYANMPLADIQNANYQISYTLADFMKDITTDGNIYASNVKVGTITVNNTSVIINFDHSFIDNAIANHQAGLNGTFFVESHVDSSYVEIQKPDKLVIGNVQIDLAFEEEILAKNVDIEINKSIEKKAYYNTSKNRWEMVYRLDIIAKDDGAKDVKVIDYFTQNQTYVKRYIDVTGNRQNVGTSNTSPFYEVGSSSTNRGKIYIGFVSKDSNKNINTITPADTNKIDPPGTLVYEIGDMSANETRTLYYTVEIDENYTGGKSRGSISNTADVYSKDYYRGNKSVTYSPTADVSTTKTSSKPVLQEDQSYLIDYTITVKANQNNTWTVTNVKVEDVFNWTGYASSFINQLGNLGQYITIVGGSEVIKDQAGRIIQVSNPDPSKPNPERSNDGLTSKYYIGSLSPGETKTFQYQLRVEPKIWSVIANLVKNLTFRNTATTRDDDTKTNGNQSFGSSYVNTAIENRHWLRKINGNEIKNDITIPMSGEAYDATTGTISKIKNPPGNFVVPAGSYEYTVFANENGEWDLSSTVMKDNLVDAPMTGDEDFTTARCMEFVGYVKVDVFEVQPGITSWSTNTEEVVDIFDQKEPTKTVWVKIDGTKHYEFKPEDINAGGEYAYRLTYYGKVIPPEDGKVYVLNNEFSMEGEVGIGGQIYILTGIQVYAQLNISGSITSDYAKYSWYYDREPSPGYNNGKLYWIIKYDGTKVQKDMEYWDSLISYVYLRDHPSMDYSTFHPDRVAGTFKGNLDIDELRSYSNFDELIRANVLSPVDVVVQTAWESPDDTSANRSFWYYTFDRDIELNNGESFYLILVSEPEQPLNQYDKIYVFGNQVTREDRWGGVHESDTYALFEIPGSKGVAKLAQSLYSVKKLSNGTFERKRIKEFTSNILADLKVDTLQSVHPNENIAGYYIDWAIPVNTHGNLNGQTVTIEEQIPEGLELGYVSTYDVKNGKRTYTIQQPSLVQDGWKEMHTSRTVTNVGTINTYAYQKDQTVKWTVEDVKGEMIFHVVCKVVDQDVLLNNEEKDFINTVMLYENEQLLDQDSSEISVQLHTLSKSDSYNANTNGGRIPFKIEVNENSEDLIRGKDTITVIDELSDTLAIDLSTVKMYYGDKTKSENKGNLVDTSQYSISVEGSKISFTIPDGHWIIIEYETFVQAAPGQNVKVINKAHWEGYEAGDSSIIEKNNFSYLAGGTVDLYNNPFVRIMKYDQFDATKLLPGAKFDVIEQEVSNGNIIDKRTGQKWTNVTTGADGIIEVGNDNSNPMKYNTIYKIVETQAPTGYILDSTPHYFVVAKKVNNAYPDVLTSYSDKGVHIYYLGQIYEYQAFNHKGEIIVDKQFIDQNTNVQPISGTYSFGLYKVIDGNEQLVEIKDLRVTTANPSHLVAFEDLDLNSTYVIYELDDEGNKISNQQYAFVANKQYNVSYSDSTISLSTDSPEATVTITNSVHYTKLPQTGGIGTMPIKLIGLGLMVGSIGLLYYKKKKQD